MSGANGHGPCDIEKQKPVIILTGFFVTEA